MSGLRLDVGCGPSKKEGTIGLDKVGWPGVDHTVDFETDPLPFPDGSVQYVFSAHCLEHLQEPGLLFREISRICEDGARLEFWTPYGWDNSAFVLGHRTFYNEDHYLHICLWYAGLWRPALGKRWVLRDIVYVIEPAVLADLFRRRIELDFAVRHYKGVVREFGALIDVWRDFPEPDPSPRRWFAVGRSAERYPLPAIAHPAAATPPAELTRAIAWFSPLAAPPPPASRRSPAHQIARVRRVAGRLRILARDAGMAAVLRKTRAYIRRRVQAANPIGR